LNAKNQHNHQQKPAHFDANVVVIGAGAGGLVAAYLAAAAQAKVILIEQDAMGGECLNTGCVPSKALIHLTKTLANSRQLANVATEYAPIKLDFAKLMTQVQEVIAQIAPHDSIERYTKLGVSVLTGTARLTSPWHVEVSLATGEVHEITTRSIVIAAGARPIVPMIPGLSEGAFLTSQTLWTLRECPRRLLILGGGPMGCEMAQCFSRLGSQVILVERAARLLANEDEDVSAFVLQRFQHEGIQVYLNYQVKQIDRSLNVACVVAECEGQQVRLDVDHILLAVGRIANTEGYGLEALGIKLSKQGSIAVNGFQQTNYAHIFACGDVSNPEQLTHAAAHQAWYAVMNALFGTFKKFRLNAKLIPRTVFIEPELAFVGLNEQRAHAQGIAYRVHRYDLADLDRAIIDGVNSGFIKVLTKPHSDTILGVSIVGEHASELLAEFVLAMNNALGLGKILGTVHSYPTYTEANKYVAGVWRRTTMPKWGLRLLVAYHRWRR
jgi:pyruvate/2-oxoglutarate dehydrogenase complex dihydrolipoamide dehydrogenase (E3) component